MKTATPEAFAAALLLVMSMLACSASAQLRPANAAAVEDSPGASDIEQEFQELGRQLGWMLEDPFQASMLAERLAVFPLRFGVELRDTPQWPAFQARASGLLGDLETANARVSSGEGPGVTRLGDLWASMARCTLLEIVGRANEAQALLDAAVSADDCPYCKADDEVALFARRSEHWECAGDLPRALQWQLDTCFALDTAMTGVNQPTYGPLVRARCGLLLCRTGHVDEGTLVLRSILRNVPEGADLSVATRMARAELQRLGAPAERSGIALEGIFLSWCRGWRSCAALVLTDENRPGWIHLLAAQMPAMGDEPGSRTVAFDTEAIEQLRPAVETVLLHDDYGLWGAGPALQLAQGLHGGAEQYVDPLLDRMAAAGTESFSGTERIDTALRWLYGGAGPTFPDSLPKEGSQFAAAWREWRTTLGR